MNLPPIHIVGAGIAGLTLARSLKQKGIQAIIFEKNPSAAKHNYGITLQPRAWQALLNLLEMDAHLFSHKVAVDGMNGGRGVVRGEDRAASGSGGLPSQFRAHCGRLEGVLRENLKIEWGHVLQNIVAHGNGHVLEFKDKEKVHATFVVDTCGVHSPVRKALLPDSEPNVLPYVLFRGTRQIDGPNFRNTYESNFKGGNVIDAASGDALLQIWINDYQKDLEAVGISYVYSRPARQNDSLHKPGRSLGESSDISEAFFEEVSQLSELEEPFKATFDGERMKKDRILHWLMRSSLSSLEDLVKLSQKRVVFLGDSAHAMPILGGAGATFAIEDALEFADCFTTKGIEGVDEFYTRRCNDWECGVRESKEKLKNMHSSARSIL